MTIPAQLAALAGQWTGVNHLWLDPTQPSRDSATTLTVASAARGRFLTLSYTWADEGKKQDGLLVFGGTPEGAVNAQWIDSFHMGDAFLALAGAFVAGGAVALSGHYPAPPDADWGWQISVAPLPEGRLQIMMHNVQPGEEPQLAVEATYTRGR